MTTTSAGPSAPRPLLGSWRIGLGVAMVMVILAVLGVGLATANVSFAREYWAWLVPIYGLLCIFTAWRRAKDGGGLAAPVVLRQLLHWLAIGAAVALDFYVRATGQESQASAGLNALLLLALGCFLAGVHLDWPFAAVGLLLALTLFFVAKADQYLWVLFLGTLLALAALVAGRRLLGARSAGGSSTPTHASTSSHQP